MPTFFPTDQRMLRMTTVAGGGALWGILVLGYYGLVHRPLESRGDAQRIRIAQIESQLQGNTNVTATNRQLKKTLDELQQQITTVRVRVPNEPMEANFLSGATQIAEEERLDIANFNRETTRNFEDYSEVEVVIRGHGSFASVCRFLDRVNKLDRLSTVRKMSIKSSPDLTRYPFEVRYALQYGMKTSSAENGKEDLL